MNLERQTLLKLWCNYKKGVNTLIPKGEYDGNTSYKKMEFVIYEGITYISLINKNDADPTDENSWLKVGIEEAPIDGKMYGRKEGQWVEIIPVV